MLVKPDSQVALWESREVSRVVKTGRKHHCRFIPMFEANPIDRTLWFENWVLAPADDFSKPIPREAWKQLAIFEMAKPTIKQVLLADETPKELSAPQKPQIEIPRPEISVDWKEAEKWAKRVGVGAVGVATIAGTAMLVSAAAAAAVATAAVTTTAIGVVPLILGVALVDPIMIAVIEVEAAFDGQPRHVWMEVCRWYD